MDYEKKYNEALEHARAEILANPGLRKMWEEIFPELRESEDERIRKALIDTLKVSETIGELKFRLPYLTREECIAYLEKQKEPNPAEWSEEDETALGDLLWCIEQARHSAKDENDMGNIWYAEKWLKERLKSIRPSWKPSEEQMRALKNSAYGSYQNGDGPLLRELYDDLLKLK